MRFQQQGDRWNPAKLPTITLAKTPSLMLSARCEALSGKLKQAYIPDMAASWRLCPSHPWIEDAILADIAVDAAKLSAPTATAGLLPIGCEAAPSFI